LGETDVGGLGRRGFALLQGRGLGCGLRVREDVLREIETWSALHRRLAIGCLVAVLDPLERQRPPAPLGVDPETQHRHDDSMSSTFTLTCWPISSTSDG